MRIKTGLAVLAAAASMAFGMATPAQAIEPCPSGLFCLYYNSNYGGANSNYNWSTPNLAGDRYPCCATGHAQLVKNNAASARNNQVNAYVRVHFNSNYAGANDLFSPGQNSNLVNTYNNNASLYFWL
ncbi:peptidase inhibitor family I36 protein [Streptomyces niveus]